MTSVAVIGAGNMGSALVAGMVQSGLLPPDRITAVDVVEDLIRRLKTEFGGNCSGEAGKVVEDHDVIVLAVKPQVWHPVVEGFSALLAPTQLVLSIMAGVHTSAIEGAFMAEIPVIRVMPNILAQVRASISALCRGRNATEDHLRTARAVIGSVGETVEVKEGQMDAVTGLSGSGPAYVYEMIDALAEGGVKAGLTQEIAMRLAVQTVFGSAKMVLESGCDPVELRDRVTSPGGTTLAGLQAMTQSGFRSSLIGAVAAAARRSRELGGGDGDC